MDYNPRLRTLILEVVKNQIKINDPPITKQTLRRLTQSGYTREQAKEKIAVAEVDYLWQILHDNKPFDTEKYTESLNSIS